MSKVESWQVAHREERAAYNATRRAAMTPAQRITERVQHRPTNARYRKAHHDLILERDRARKTPEYRRTNYLATLDRSRERGRRDQILRRARLANAPGAYTEAEWLAASAEFGDCCAYCGTDGIMTLDHVIPITLGGSNDIANIVPACESCNKSKGHSYLSEWLGIRPRTGTPPARHQFAA